MFQELCIKVEIDWVVTSTVIMMIATVIMAIFTALTWLILKRQDKLRNDPEVRVHCYKPEIAARAVGLERFDLLARTVLVNPGTVPSVVTDIKDIIKDVTKGQDLEVRGSFYVPTPRPERVYISQLPWVIAGGGFAICERKYSLPMKAEEKELCVQLEFTYFVSKKQKTLKTPELLWKPEKSID